MNINAIAFKAGRQRTLAEAITENLNTFQINKVAWIDMKVPYRIWPLTQEMKNAVLKHLEKVAEPWPRARAGHEEVTKFEKEFAEYVGSKYAIATSNGSTASHIAMSVLGVGPGDEVITAVNGYTSSADCALWVGAKPQFVEMDEETFNLNPDKLNDKITNKTKVIIPQHMYGHPADMDPIMEIAEKHGLHVVEDACHSTGSAYKGKKSGSIGDFGFYSFSGKIIHCYGSGGMLVTDNEEFAEKAVLYRHTQNTRSDRVIAYNCNMSGWNPVLGRITLKKIDDWNKKRRENAKLYTELFEGLVNVETPIEKDYADHAWLHYVIRAENRDKLQEFLLQKGIETKIHYPTPIPLQNIYKERFGYKEGMFPLSERNAKKILSLSPRFDLTKKEIEYVVNSVKEFYG